MPSKDTQLRKVLTLSQTVGLAITVVIGGGLLVLPGIVYQKIGPSAVYVWLLDALLVIPLLMMVAKLGAKWPSAGGIAGFMRNSFSRRWGMATEVLLIGTMGLAVPAIALIGGQYFAILLNNENLTFECGAALLFIAIAINWYGVSVSAHTQRILAFALCGILFVVALIALVFGDHLQGVGFAPVFSLETWSSALPGAALVFFAFTGWEELTAISEEYHNPKRNFPLSIAISFVVIIILYLLVAMATQLTLSQFDPQVTIAPIALLLSSVIGPLGTIFISIVAVLIIFAHLISAVWVASRLVFFSAREGLLPRYFVTLNRSYQAPRLAILFCAFIFASVLCIDLMEFLHLEDILRISGKKFFFLYALCTAAYFKMARTMMEYVLSAVGLVIIVSMGLVFGWEILYPLSLLSIGLLITCFVDLQKKD